MEIKGIKWMGICTTDWNGTVGFYRDVLGLAMGDEGNLSTTEDRQVRCAELTTASGDFVELFDANLPERDLFTAPVIGFLVDDVPTAREELEKKGVTFVGPVYRGIDWTWSYFR